MSETVQFYNLFARSLIMFLSVLILHKMTPTPDLVTCGDEGIRKQEERLINYLLLFKGLLHIVYKLYKNKTKYFRLRLSDEVRTERPNRD